MGVLLRFGNCIKYLTAFHEITLDRTLDYLQMERDRPVYVRGGELMIGNHDAVWAIVAAEKSESQNVWA